MVLATPLVLAAALAAGAAPSAPAAVPAAARASEAPAPRLSIDSATFDAGSVTRPDKITHEYVVTNSGQADLHLQVRAHCGCTATSVDDVIAPGKTGKVSLAVSTERFSGPIQKGATLFTDDPAQATVELTLKGVVKVPPGETPRPTPVRAPAAKPAPAPSPTAG